MKLCQAFETSTTTWADAATAINSGGGGSPNRDCYIFVNADVTAGGTASANFGAITGIAVNIRGTGKIILDSGATGSLLYIYTGQTVNLKDATFNGHSTNGSSLVYVDGGTFNMEGGNINGNNKAVQGGGVYVTGTNATFDLKSLGLVKTNTASNVNNLAYTGKQVCVVSGTFTINGSAPSPADVAQNDGIDYYW